MKRATNKTTEPWVACRQRMPPVGLVVELKTPHVPPLGAMVLHGRYFLHDDGAFYRVKPPQKVTFEIAKWRPWA